MDQRYGLYSPRHYSVPINGVEELTLYYGYSCSPFTFDCRDPAVLSQPLNCSAPKPPTPEVETYLNASCGNYQLNPSYGNGFCNEELNFFECGDHGAFVFSLSFLFSFVLHAHVSPLNKRKRRLLPAELPPEPVQWHELHVL